MESTCGCHLNHATKAEHDQFWKAYTAKRKAAVAKKERRSKKHKVHNPRPQNRGKPRRKEFVGTYHEYLQSKQWAKKRQQARKHYGSKCTVCKSAHNLHVHHRHYRTLFREAMADLDLLCNGCHGNHHERDGKACDPMTREFLALASSF